MACGNDTKAIAKLMFDHCIKNASAKASVRMYVFMNVHTLGTYLCMYVYMYNSNIQMYVRMYMFRYCVHLWIT